MFFKIIELVDFDIVEVFVKVVVGVGYYLGCCIGRMLCVVKLFIVVRKLGYGSWW